MKLKTVRQVLLYMSRNTLYAIIANCILISTLYAESSSAQDIKSVTKESIRLNLNRVSVIRAFKEIESKTDYVFIYRPEDITSDIRISGNFTNSSVADVLIDISRQADLKFKQINNTIHVANKERNKKPEESIEIVIQGITITGRVVSEEDNSGLPGVNVMVKGTLQGTVTDVDGNYSINVPDENAILLFSSVGFLQEEVAVANQTVIDLSMTPDVTALEEIVVVGYGTQTKTEITSAVSSLKGDLVEEVPTQTLTSVLQGRMTGVRVLQNSGQPGNQLNVRIRGGSSVNKSNDPLYIVDGFPRDINDVNVQDIESMEVLKDAASTSIYGARASNGVVLITTKRGKEGKANFDFHASFGTQEMPRTIDKITAEQFISLYRPAIQQSQYKDGVYLNGAHSLGTGNGDNSPWSLRFLGDGESVPSGYRSITDPVTGQTLIFQDNELQETLFQRAPTANYYLSANGGSNNIKYAAGVGFTDQDGVAIGTNWQRYSGRVNVDYQVNKRLSFSTLADFSYSKTNSFPNETDIFARGVHVSRTIRDKMPDGSTPWGINGNLSNPLWVTETRENLVQRTTATLGIGATWEIIDHLKFKAMGNYHINNYQVDYFEKAHQFNQSRPANATRNQLSSGQVELTLNYQRAFAEKHNLNALVGYTNLYIKDDNLFASAFGASTDNIPTLNAAPNKTESTTFLADERLISQFARVFYNYDYRYLFSASLRRDGSSKFGSDNKYGLFPSVSAGWVISAEPFFADGGVQKVISNLKLRASWGQTGNNSVSRYQSQGNYSAIYSYGGNAGISATQMPNNNLGWETTTQSNFGLDLGFLEQERIYGSVDYFEKTTDDLLFTVQLPRETGFSNIETNIGSIKYNGIEFTLGARIIDNGSFRWTTDFNFSHITNEVTKLPAREGVDKNRINGLVFPDGTGIGGIAEGEPLGNFFGYKVAFIIDNEEQASKAHFDQQARGYDPETGVSTRGQKFPGDFEWMDRDGDGSITVFDQYVLGNSEPTSFGGFNNKFEYKGFDLNIFFDFTRGHSINDRGRAWLNGNGARELAPTTDVLSAWKQPGDAATAGFPRISFHDPQGQRNNFRLSDFQTYKADFISLRDVRIGYTFPESLIQRTGFIRKMRVYIGGNNLFYITDYPGYSPERGGVVFWGNGTYPSFRTYIAGLKIGF
ncbi:MAG: TonB-dependent receptor [Cytophagales bacterium]|nr:TonB-dependent receptor [Cytophagales bacterium]